MAYIVRTYACDGSEEVEAHTFELMQDREDGPPRFCPKCGAEFEDDIEPIPSRIAIGGSAITKSTDMTYRQLEESSAARAQELDAPYLKITDLKDNLREGDIAAKTLPNNTIAQFEREAEAKGIPHPSTGWGGGFAAASAGARVAPPMSSGAPGMNYAGPGHIALSQAQPEHPQRVHESMASTKYRPFVGDARDTGKFKLQKR